MPATRRQFLVQAGVLAGAELLGCVRPNAQPAQRERKGDPTVPIHFSKLLAAQRQTIGSDFAVQSIDLSRLRAEASPVVVLDDFRVSGRPFGPHPHAGLSAVTYVLEDSPGALRSLDSLGGNIVMGSGGIVWTQAGKGMMHEEIPAVPHRELHGLQIFVNLNSKNKFVTPEVLSLEGKDVPEWRSDAGDRVRVVVGAFAGKSSPLVPAEPFHLLDVELRREIGFDLEQAQNALVYVLQGNVLARAGEREQAVPASHAIVLHGGSGRVAFETSAGARFVILSGHEIREPVVVSGPFIMNDRAQLQAAVARYQAGEMGHLEPYREG